MSTTSPSPKPLTRAEKAFWYAFVRAIVVVPRVLDAELIDAERLSANEYAVLVILSESEGRQLRMAELAERTSLTVSGMTRVVQRLVDDGLAERLQCNEDRRGAFASLTDKGFERLERAYPVHLEGARRHVIDHLAGFDLAELARAFALIGEEQPITR
jgi:DNA-binding MarR family transcriptional regulator